VSTILFAVIIHLNTIETASACMQDAPRPRILVVAELDPLQKASIKISGFVS